MGGGLPRERPWGPTVVVGPQGFVVLDPSDGYRVRAWGLGGEGYPPMPTRAIITGTMETMRIAPRTSKTMPVRIMRVMGTAPVP
jgi:hypothetical protein